MPSSDPGEKCPQAYTGSQIPTNLLPHKQQVHLNIVLLESCFQTSDKLAIFFLMSITEVISKCHSKYQEMGIPDLHIMNKKTEEQQGDVAWPDTTVGKQQSQDFAHLTMVYTGCGSKCSQYLARSYNVNLA